MKRLLAEPMLHFLALGAAVFGAYALVPGAGAPESRDIVVTTGRIESLRAGFTRTWHRPPSEDELKGLIDDYICEEIYAREAVAMGLDRDDAIIRRRLRQKFEFLAEDIAAVEEPTDGELHDFLVAHPERFQIDRRYTFRQVYLNSDRRGDSVGADAAALLAELITAGPKADPVSWGDSTMLDHSWDGVSAREVARQFGSCFAEALGEIPIGQWQGPVESGYGVHLVLVSERNEGRLPTLDEALDDVYREWTAARRLGANETFYRSLRERYTVVMEPAPPAKPSWQTASTR